MASLATACRASMRAARSRASARGFSTSARCLAAQNFIMPALSPTMTEGNIASWRVKEGESFSAGDVLLEIETDKATMDVEAQEDGIMMKIMSQDGSKAVPVGTRIAVLAEAGDDIAALEIPADEQPKQAAAATSEPASSETKSESKPDSSSSSSQQQKPAQGGQSYEHKHPLMPSVEHLVKAHGISEADVSKIKPTGPNGRLLKGDVLAFLGSISAETPAAVSSRFDHLAHLDLSNIKVAEKKKEAAAAAAVPAPPVEEEELPLEVNVPVSLAKVTQVQRKIQDTLGVFLPLSTFISRAAEVANDELPPARREPTAGELFDAVLGLDKVKGARSSRGIYLPQVSAIPAGATYKPKGGAAELHVKHDIIDELAGRPAQAPRTPSMVTIDTVPGLSSGGNVFTLTVPKTEEERAYVFLQRCKFILEDEPGRLVL
ncbi:pyruvate dehydrogenase protein x component [Cordyceps fumosorosea ARSEF 2679]|uniref:Pyruvate dehydrogenase protein x component n=1 Tax=Cordyceps fumosorosea (strain ARSEF 2679) TaxID=1081104 RepID=A0A168EJZ2_CORFA|nr:pyruvate dehydrogenase protein x component [Cordyceps fumosorosea ARSEF 2679]OAA73906.1 pyruvate dehydrogenase protein x component [Cordyceps fumosorosea ARSEF 2679]